jgi:PAS domain S-box-containing protein
VDFQRASAASPGSAIDFSVVSQQAAVGLAILSAAGRILWLNAYLADWLGYPAQDLIEACWEDLTQPSDRESEALRWQQLRQGVLPSTQTVKRWRGSQGQELLGSETLSVVPHSAERPLQILAHVQPVLTPPTDETKLPEADRIAAIGQFTVGLAHEGRNALQQITACSEMLQMELRDAPEPLDLVNGILDAGDRLHRLFDDMRAYSTRLQLDLRSTDLRTVWQSAWRLLETRRITGDWQLAEVDLPRDLSAYISASHLEQAFVRILKNAIDAGGPQHRIEIHGETSELNSRPALLLSIRDFGPGFSGEALARAFEPFATSKARGTGLGLPIIRRLVEANGGLVSVRNLTAGGAAIELILPRSSC